MDELLSFSALTWRAGAPRQHFPVELVQAHLDRIAEVNPRIHAAIEVFAEQSLGPHAR
jgi:Asp-tRNA(Asn)/Glu-tRNA(Gln) amidotransferase A subunit family amidase